MEKIKELKEGDRILTVQIYAELVVPILVEEKDVNPEELVFFPYGTVSPA